MSIPRWGGRVWDAHGKHGYRYVFVGAAVIALLNLLLASLIRVSERAAADPVAPPVAADGPTGQETLPEGGAE
ncbi:MAG: hypothetical protein FJX74_11935, partial [Armatimonadetes bacterium]|nr:hypothetical protein [Armatimonadota bacterium]